MQITTQVQTSDPNYPYDDTQAASQVLAALGGSTVDDTSTAIVKKLTTMITTNVELGATDNMAYTIDQAADQVLAALAGNPTTDTCIVVMVMPMAQGQAGVVA
jgi:arginine repressor